MREMRVPDLIDIPDEIEAIRTKRENDPFFQRLAIEHQIIFTVPDRSTLWRRLTRRTRRLRLLMNNQIVQEPGPKRWWQ